MPSFAPTPDGVRVAYTDLGGGVPSGPSILFAHATGFHGHVWRPVARRLADDFRGVIFDERGHGDTAPAEDGQSWHGFAVDALAVVAGAAAAVLSSDWENLPHSAVEALSVGVPVVATAVGGVPEVVREGENGLLVPPRRPDALAAALTRLLEEPGLRERLAAAAKPSVAGLSSEEVYGKLEAVLSGAIR